LFAVGGSDTVARLSGIQVNKIKYLASIIAGLLVGIAGLVSMSRTFSGSPYAGGTLSIDVISAAVLGGVSIMGGTGKTYGLVTGVIIMGTLSVGLNMMNMNTNSQEVFKGAMRKGIRNKKTQNQRNAKELPLLVLVSRFWREESKWPIYQKRSLTDCRV